jgi:hypothetical protein
MFAWISWPLPGVKVPSGFLVLPPLPLPMVAPAPSQRSPLPAIAVT